MLAAVERIHADTGAWPGRLADLCPRSLDAVPLACWRPVANDFVSVVPSQNPMLWYVELPPSGKRTDLFADRRWLAGG